MKQRKYSREGRSPVVLRSALSKIRLKPSTSRKRVRFDLNPKQSPKLRQSSTKFNRLSVTKLAQSIDKQSRKILSQI